MCRKMQESGLTEIITFLCISVADGCQMAGIVLPGHPPGSEIHTVRARIKNGRFILIFGKTNTKL